MADIETPSTKLHEEVEAGRWIFWIEGRMQDRVRFNDNEEFQDRLKDSLSKSYVPFQLFDDILAHPTKARDALGKVYQEAVDNLLTLKIVESTGPETHYSSISLYGCELRVQLYHLYPENPSFENETENFPQAEMKFMPNFRYERKWDELVFDHDLKSNLTRMMWNITQLSALGENSMNPLILLHGPPGTGKTTLCQALAQKVSIRLSQHYYETRLVEIRTASLLSKYFGQSAKHVEDIFQRIVKLCTEDAERFVCVLVDEVESIASCRERTVSQGEAQDSLRATNALLTGIDRLKDYKNVIMLCTTNFLDCLDAAFLDRCAVKQAIDIPGQSGQYKILRHAIQDLINKKLITSGTSIPNYEDAKSDYDVKDFDTPGAKVLVVLKELQAHSTSAQSSWTISGRSLAQLSHTAMMMFMQGKSCSLSEALGYIRKYIDLEHGGQPGEVAKGHDEIVAVARENSARIELRGRKRKLTILMEEDCDETLLKEFVDYLRRRRPVYDEERTLFYGTTEESVQSPCCSS